MSAAEEVARIAEATVIHPGDTLVIKVDTFLTDTLVDQLRDVLPDTIKVLVFDKKAHLYVLRSGEVTP